MYSKRVIFQLIDSDSKKNEHEINTINDLLKKYNEEYPKTTDKDLDKIISACDDYIIKIPKKLRKREPSIAWSTPLAEYWPTAEQVLNIQKLAVNYVYLPSSNKHSKARWALLKQFFIPQESKDFKIVPAIKRMEDMYFTECHYQGRNFIMLWINSEGYTDAHYFRSFKEVIKETHTESSAFAIPPRYLISEVAEKLKVVIKKDGLLYFKHNDEILTISSTSALHMLVNAALYVVDPRGNFYINPPDRKIAGDYHHSVYLRGRPVICAGVIKVIAGKVTFISNESGHYRPKLKNLLILLLWLNSQKVNLKKTVIRYVYLEEKKIKEKQFLGIDAFLGFVCLLGNAQRMKAKIQDTGDIALTPIKTSASPAMVRQALFNQKIEKIITPSIPDTLASSAAISSSAIGTEAIMANPSCSIL